MTTLTEKGSSFSLMSSQFKWTRKSRKNQFEPLRIFVYFFLQTINLGYIAQLTFHTVHGENCSYGSYDRKFDLPLCVFFFTGKINSVRLIVF